MGINRGKVARIVWNGNALEIGYPLDSVVSYSTAREGSEWVRSKSGAVDAWIEGTDYHLECTVRWIPTLATTDPVATGWDGAVGWSGLLAWCRDGGALTFFPDKSQPASVSCYLRDPLFVRPELEDDGTRRLQLSLIASSPFEGY